MTTFINNTKTAVLLAAMFGLILIAGWLLGNEMGLIFAFVLGGAGAIISYFFSDTIAIKAMRGQPADPQRHGDLIEMIERLARNANLPMPKVYICPQQAPNAFATGRNPKHAAVAVTQGALRLLDYDELEGVMAHELAHVKNRDTLISTVAAVIAGAISSLGWIFMFGGGNNREGGHPALMLVFLIVGPLAAGLIQMAISRSREFVADAEGARIAGSPDGLIAALRKLEAGARHIPMQHETPSMNHMFIVQPLSGLGGLKGLFSTHPPTAQRIQKLQSILG